MHARVLDHYDSKYAGEAEASAPLRVIAPTRAPRDRFEACVSALPALFRGGDLLELGAGSGLIAHSLLANGLDCRRYTVTELSAARLQGLTRRLNDPRVRALQLDVEDESASPGEPVDAILMVALVEHLFDPIRALRRVRSWLRPGGFVYLDTPNIAKYTRRLKLLAGRFPSTASGDEGLTTYAGEATDLHDEGHLHYFTYRSLERLLLERCGFARVERRPYVTPSGALPQRLDFALARAWPQLFAELCVVAYA